MKDVVDGCVSFGDELKVKVKGCGTICLSDDDKEIRVEDVYFVPNLKSNIISLGKLMEKGYMISMEGQLMHLKDKEDRLIILVETSKNYIFEVNFNIMLEGGLQNGHNVIVNQDVKVREESAWTCNNQNVMCEKQADNGPKIMLLESNSTYHKSECSKSTPAKQNLA
ncbi:hypothetical protein Tco_0811612 [Tanacetum coccineum]